MTFEELGVREDLLRAIGELGFESPMPVQEKVIPHLLHEDSDVVALAQTGTGKTAAFGLPVIQRTDVKLRKPQALILSPTRELCLQIGGDLADYSKYTPDLKVLPVYGGSSIESQIRSLRQGVQIIVATPGRLLDLIKRGTVDMTNVHTVILDEADEMLNMGFVDDINSILENVPDDRKMMLFSATMPDEIAKIAKNYMHSPVEFVIGTKNEGAENVRHIYYMVNAKDKYLALKRIADANPNIYAIIFCRTRRETQEIADNLIGDGYNVDALHGDLSQAQRDTVMKKFREHTLQLLVATDVAARGLDVDNLTHVINYGLPDDIATYTHRSGRTGRAGKTGISVAIIHSREQSKLRAIEKKIGKTFEHMKVPTPQYIIEKQLYNLADRIEKVKVNETEIEKYLPGIVRKLEWLSESDLLKRVVSLEFNRFLDYYKNAPEIEQPKANEKKSEAKESRKGDKEKVGRKAEKGYTRLFLNLGKTDGFYTNQIIDLVNRNLRKERIQIGRIDLMQNFSFFEVIQEQAPQVLKALNKVVLSGGRKVCVEIAGENTGKSDKSGKKKKVAAEKKADKPSKVEKAKKPSREERGYTSPRGPKKKDDWKQFFQQDIQPLRGEEPDFSEEGWAKRSKRKK